MKLDPWGFGMDLPDDGQDIEYRAKGGPWTRGRVDFCWCGIEPVIQLVVTPPSALSVMVHLGLGEEWRPTP